MKMSEEQQKARGEQRIRRYDELKQLSKEELYQKARRLYRISSISPNDAKRDLIYAVLDAELPVW